jgi:hypothetical protein
MPSIQKLYREGGKARKGDAAGKDSRAAVRLLDKRPVLFQS